MSERKVIQISTLPGNDSGDIIVALCNDGTIWHHWLGARNDFHDKWYPVPAIPQPETQNHE